MMETQTDDSEPAKKNTSTDSVKPLALLDKDESGFGDISTCSPDDSLCNSQSNNFPVSASTPLEKAPSNNYNFSKRDDSGMMCPEQSPGLAQKEMTDADVSEIASESMDGISSANGSKEDFLDVTNENNHCANSTVGNNHEIGNVHGKSGDEKLGDTSNGSSGPSGDVNMDHGENRMESDSKEKTVLNHCIDNNVNDKIMKCDTENLTDAYKKESKADMSDNEDEDFEEFVKKTLQSRSHVRKLVDYGNSSSDRDTDEDGVKNESTKIGKGNRNYRKRKQESDSDSENEVAEPQGGSGDIETGTGEPVLLRHSQLNDNGANSVSHLPDLDSDSSNSSDDETGKVKQESSESEQEDTPMDITEYGPPKHKWRSLFDIRNREIGYLPSKRNGLFTRRVQGSLQMVQRFDLQYKMNHHEGCVNALNFNRTGKLNLVL